MSLRNSAAKLAPRRNLAVRLCLNYTQPAGGALVQGYVQITGDHAPNGAFEVLLLYFATPFTPACDPCRRLLQTSTSGH